MLKRVLVIAMMTTLMVSGAYAAIDGYDPVLCPDGPSGPDSFYCDGVNTIPGDGSGCYDIDANPDCTPLPPGDCVPGNDCEQSPDYCFRDGDADAYGGVETDNPNVDNGTPMCLNLDPTLPENNPPHDLGCAHPNWGAYIPCTAANLCQDVDVPCPDPCDPAVDPTCGPPPCDPAVDPTCFVPPGEARSFMIKKATCVNKTTGQKVEIKNQSMTLDCEAAGLEMIEGDEVFIKMKGIVN